MDIGVANCGNNPTPFVEVCSVGLVSTLFPAVDDIQHGNLARIGDFLAAMVASPPAEIQLILDKKQKISSLGHIVLVSNMPYLGFHYQISALSSHKDGYLDVLFFADLSKLELLNYVFQGVGEGKPEDPRIQHYHVRKIAIKTKPSMPIMVDGIAIGEGEVQIEVKKHVLAVMVPGSSETLKNTDK